MKNLVKFFFAALLMFSMPVIVSAQTAGQDWIKLGDAIRDYKYNGQTHYHGEITPKDRINITTKLAYKKNSKKEILSESKLNLRKINGVNVVNGSLDYDYDSEPIVISNGFDIKYNGEKIKKNSLPSEGEWVIYDIGKVAVIESLTGLQNKPEDTDLLENIYIFIDPQIYAQLNDEINEKSANLIEASNKAKENKNKAKRAAALVNAYFTPEKAAWKPVKTETLEDGTIVEHYAEGVRYYKKSNGDFASFIQPKDIRDKETLNVTKGTDIETPSESCAIGDYKITYSNGVIMQRIEDTEEVIFPDGKILRYMNNVKPKGAPDRVMDYEIDNDAISKAIDLNWNNTLNQEKTILPIFYRTFNFPDVSMLFEKSIKNYGGSIDEAPKFQLIDNNKMINQYSLINRMTEQSSKRYRSMYYFLKEDWPQLYTLDNEGLKPAGIYTTNNFKRINAAYFIPLEVDTFDSQTKTYHFKKNGDYIKGHFDECHLTASDGTVIEKFPDIDKYKVTRTNGDVFIGKIEPSYFMYQLEFGDGLPHYTSGTLTAANGKKSEYYNEVNKTEEKAQNEKMEKERLTKLYSQYGKAGVDDAMLGNIKVGMSVAMLKECLPQFVRGSVNFHSPKSETGSTIVYRQFFGATYKNGLPAHEYRDITVNKSTGKVISVGAKYIILD